MKKSQYKSMLKYLSALLLFGSNGIVANLISLNSPQIVLLRTLIGSLLLILIFVIKKEKLTFYHYKKHALFLLLSGMAMGGSWIFLYEAYARIGVGISSLLYYCGPVVVMALSPLIFKEHLSVNKICGFIAVAVGVILINATSNSTDGNTFGIICGLMSAVMYSLMIIFNKKASKITGLENSTLQLTIAFLTVLMYAVCSGDIVMPLVKDSILPILFLGLVNTGFGCYLYFSSIGKLNVQTVAIVGYLEPLSAVVFSAVFLKEALSPYQIMGAFLIIGGAMIAELLSPKRA